MDFKIISFAFVVLVAGRATVAGMLDLQREIDDVAACGGGVVRVAPGEREVRPFVLKSNVTLELAEGAVLLASTNIADYAAALGERCFVGAEGATNVAIVGRGVIDGRGAVFREIGGLKGESQPQALPVLMRFTRCRDLRLEGFTYRCGAAWGCHLRNCDGVAMRRVKCFNHVNNTNDGIDVESANVTIEDCDIDADDDAIAFKTESDKSFAVTNVAVRNCRLASCCNAVKFGTGSYADFRDVTIENCSLVRAKGNHRFSWWESIPGVTNRICGIAALALEVVDGGIMENVTVRDVSWTGGVQTPLFVRLDRRHEPKPGRKTFFRNVLVENIRGDAESRIACSLTGVPGLKLSGITLRNIDFSFPGGGTCEEATAKVVEAVGEYPDNYMFGHAALPAWGMYFRHCDGIAMDRVSLRLKPGAMDARPPVVKDDANVSLKMDIGTSHR